MKFFFVLFILFTSRSHADEWKFRIIEDARTLFAPISQQAFNKALVIEFNSSESVGASADHNEINLKITVDNGLLKSPRLTPDGLRMVICHELGHLFGGSPRKNIPMEWDGPVAHDGKSFMSSEGQADYYASSVCFRRLIALEKVEPLTDLNRAGPVLKNKCSVVAGFKGKELEACLRAGLAGEDFLKLVFEFPVSCEKEDLSITPVLIRDSYPGRQCRLDTIVSGSLCGSGLGMIMNFDDSSLNTCPDQISYRPLCWYRD